MFNLNLFKLSIALFNLFLLIKCEYSIKNELHKDINLKYNNLVNNNYCSIESTYISNINQVNLEYDNNFCNSKYCTEEIDNNQSKNLNLTSNECVIKMQREIIDELLRPLITSNYVLLDLPYHSNIGDTLIWKGEEDFLSTIPYKCIYRCALNTFEYKKFPEDTVILIHGGGNFGDIYLPHNKSRLSILKLYPNNKIIFLPQTVYYQNIQIAKKDTEIFRKHKNLTIFARDEYSYNFLNELRFSHNIKLMPDMAFYINLDWLKTMKLPSNGKNLFFKRIDKEAKKTNYTNEILGIDNYDISDWPLFGQKESMINHLYSLVRKHKFKKANEYAIKTYLPHRIRMGVNFISQYNKIVSTRLHGAILSILLNKEITIIDNSYGKNSQYYNTWLQNVEKISLNSEIN